MSDEAPEAWLRWAQHSLEKEGKWPEYICQELAAALSKHVAKKRPQSAVFGLPEDWKMAAMVREDLADARAAWLQEAKSDGAEIERRNQSDFLAETNHEGGRLDFHALRHTCGAWLAMSGAHPKVVQTVMRHSTITLTMDTYGHLFPGQEAEAAGNMGLLFGCVSKVCGGAPQGACRAIIRGTWKDSVILRVKMRPCKHRRLKPFQKRTYATW